MIEASMNAWASYLGVDQQTLERRLVKSGYKRNGREDIDFRHVLNLLTGDEQMQRTRNLTLDADRKEREEQLARGEVVTMVDVEKLLTEYFIAPLSNALNSAPTSLDTRANPTDPECARVAISAWVEEVKKILHDGLPKQ